MQRTSDLHIKQILPLIPPATLKQVYPMTEVANQTVVESRRTVIDIIEGRDPRFLMIVGPCSIHDPRAAVEYAQRFKELRERYLDRLYMVMRVYFEKPRTRLGWRGMIIDPELDGSHDIGSGLRKARGLMLEIANLGVPVGSEVLDPIVPQYLSDLITWASIGARTTESQTHRDMASGLSMPVGFKNGTDGRIESAVNALAASLAPHSFIGIDQKGRTCILNTSGNPHSHLILRGGRDGPNYHTADIDRAAGLLAEVGAYPSILVDCSHANSGKRHEQQEHVLKEIVELKRTGIANVMGLMIESNLRPGRQELPASVKKLEYGVSITDA
ncbi:MAG: 3-deoxy-7-phosphoheptulonate synthase, partial [Spirochaetales bacterium]|nr:3-deoxy-7-phosphoheptulonate synthase [Spirochaetales bacterium]MCF7939046.1 3-deoxy-7-phosphoheptulonate synthase [Spirochaetales bacterium]